MSLSMAFLSNGNFGPWKMTKIFQNSWPLPLCQTSHRNAQRNWPFLDPIWTLSFSPQEQPLMLSFLIPSFLSIIYLFMTRLTFNLHHLNIKSSKQKNLHHIKWENIIFFNFKMGREDFFNFFVFVFSFF